LFFLVCVKQSPNSECRFPSELWAEPVPKYLPLALALGASAVSYGPAGTIDEEVARLKHAHAVGLYLWDIADDYGNSEDVVGEWIKRSGKRDNICLATKFGLQSQSNGKFASCFVEHWIT
jgi:aryl-alcohol dehydrogenase-like predicted oxidoreductase